MKNNWLSYHREKVSVGKTSFELVSVSENDLFAVNQEDEFSHLFEIKLRLISSLKQISLSGG